MLKLYVCFLIKKNKTNDSDVEKILNSFKTAKIETQSTKRKRTRQPESTPKGGKKATTSSQESTSAAATSNKSNSGPYIKLVKHKLGLSSATSATADIDYSTYVVKSNEREQVLSLSEAAIMGGGGAQDATTLAKSYKLYVPKDKPTAPLDSGRVHSCSMCGHRANAVTGLGDLFGPYRVTFDYARDLINETLESSKGICGVLNKD